MISVMDEVDAGITASAIEVLVRRTLDETWVSEDADLTVVFVDEEEMAALHEKWMGEPGPTDVLSFPMDEIRPGTEGSPTPPGVLGDVAICPAVAARQAAEAGQSTERELGLLVVHGVLHLLGYDHADPEEKKVMFALQAKILGDFPANA